MIGHLRALEAAYVVQWKQTLSGLASLGIFGIFIPYMVIMGWIAGKSDNPAVLAYVPVGAIMATIWNLSSYRVGHSLRGEFFNQTLDPMIISRSPLMVVMLGKVLCTTTVAALSSPISLVTVYAVSGELPHIAHPPFLAATLAVTVVALVVTSFLLRAGLRPQRQRPGVHDHRPAPSASCSAASSTPSASFRCPWRRWPRPSRRHGPWTQWWGPSTALRSPTCS